jgi:hypothetical protein
LPVRSICDAITVGVAGTGHHWRQAKCRRQRRARRFAGDAADRGDGKQIVPCFLFVSIVHSVGSPALVGFLTMQITAPTP